MEEPSGNDNSDFGRKIASKAARKKKARRKKEPGVWANIGMFGLVGWAVAVPTLLGAALGLWLDKRYPGPESWTLTLLITGIALGCLNAWYWVQKEDRAIRKDLEDDE